MVLRQLTQTHGVASVDANTWCYVTDGQHNCLCVFCMDIVSGPSFGRVRERPFDHKAEILPRQHPPESTILLKSTAKNN